MTRGLLGLASFTKHNVLKFTLSMAHIKSSFIWLQNSSPLYGWTTLCLSTHLFQLIKSINPTKRQGSWASSQQYKKKGFHSSKLFLEFRKVSVMCENVRRMQYSAWNFCACGWQREGQPFSVNKQHPWISLFYVLIYLNYYNTHSVLC